MAKPKVQKSTPTDSGSRRARVASFESARKKDARRRAIGLTALCVVLAAAILAYPVVQAVQAFQAANLNRAEIGAPLAAAGCDPVVEEAATGNQDHVPVGTPVEYTRFPPDSGSHYDTPAPFTKRFYGTEDVPETQTLVHNLEHGYTIAWYRADAPAEQVEQLENIARTFSGDDNNPANKFIAAPWDSAEGEFPAGKTMVLTHWAANPEAPTDAAQQRGVRQACASVSGAAVDDFMTTYPYTASPEPNGA